MESVPAISDHGVRNHFPAGAVRRAVLLRHGEDSAIEPGQLLARGCIRSLARRMTTRRRLRSGSRRTGPRDRDR